MAVMADFQLRLPCASSMVAAAFTMATQGSVTLNFTRFSRVGSSCSGQGSACFTCGGAAFLREQSPTTFVYGPFQPTPNYESTRPLFTSKMGLRLSLSTSTYSKSIEPTGDSQDEVRSSDTLSRDPEVYRKPPTSRASMEDCCGRFVHYFLSAGNGGVITKPNMYIDWNSSAALNGQTFSAKSPLRDDSSVNVVELFRHIAFAPLDNASEGERRPSVLSPLVSRG